jgi:hypothetical protein
MPDGEVCSGFASEGEKLDINDGRFQKIDEQSPFVWQTLEDLISDRCQTPGNCDNLRTLCVFGTSGFRQIPFGVVSLFESESVINAEKARLSD